MEQYKVYTSRNFRQIPQIKYYLSEEEREAIEVVGAVLPFKVNNYVVDELIDWDCYQEDPIYTLTFPQQNMLRPSNYQLMKNTIHSGADKKEIKQVAHNIRMKLNPHPAGQLEQNVPTCEGVRLPGIQHKYRETILFFPSQGQTCHAYCTFCFRWPQFTGELDLKFAMRDSQRLIEYVSSKPEITDILFTGGDPLIMRTKILKQYIDTIIDARIPHLKTIRLGSKALSYWPQRFVTEPDADDLLRLLEDVQKSGLHLAFMAHFNHPNELKTRIMEKAISRVRDTGAIIRTQSPVMRHINDDPDAWSSMWKRQVALGCVPYYMFVARDTGAQHYFAVTLERAWRIFHQAYQKVSGIARTVRGPSMSAGPGKVQILGVSEVRGEKVFVLQFIQARNPDWVSRPFFAQYSPSAIWLNELKPAFGKTEFFFEKQYRLKRNPLPGLPNPGHEGTDGSVLSRFQELPD